MPTRQSLLKIAQMNLSKGKRMQVFALKNLVEAYGCSAGDSEVALSVRERLPISSAGHDEWCKRLPSEKVGMEDGELGMGFRGAVEELTHREEEDNNTDTDSWVTSGSLEHCYPLHFPDEVAFLQQHWGNLSLALKPGIFQEVDPHTGETSKWYAPHYQPINEVREYFGEHVALYFAW